MADTDQLTYNGLHATQTINIKMTRATEKTLSFAHGFGASTNITSWRYWWRKKASDDSSKTVVLSLTSTSNSAQMDLTTDGVGVITFYDDDTRGLDTSLTYDHGLEMIGTGDKEQAPFVGDATLIYEVVDDNETGSPSWTALSTFNANLDALLACNQATVLAAAAAATDSSITVNSVPDGWANGETVIIHDGTNYESSVIASSGGISGTTINLTTDGSTPESLTNSYSADDTVIVLSY